MIEAQWPIVIPVHLKLLQKVQVGIERERYVSDV